MGNQQGGNAGGPGGFGRGRRGPPMSDEEREAERKRRMEERKPPGFSPYEGGEVATSC